MNQEKSNIQYDSVINRCRNEFGEKSKKYGNSLNAYDSFGVLQKIFIKLFRLKSIQTVGEYRVEGESIEKEIPGIINYCLYGISLVRKIEYDEATNIVHELFQNKNHDYGEAWRFLSISYMVQESLVKYQRMYNIYAKLKFKHEENEDLKNDFVEVFSDICNYMIFSVIRISEGADPMI